MRKSLVAALVAATMMSGCANIMSGGTKPVTINSTPSGASFLIKDVAGKDVHQGVTPSRVTLDRGAGYFKGQTYEVRFSAPGYSGQSKSINTTLNGWYIGNLLWGGLTGFFIVDPLTGAMWTLPDDISATLVPMAPVKASAAPRSIGPATTSAN